MATIILRVLFLLVASGIAVLIFNSEALRESPSWVPWGVLGGMIAGALAIIGIDISLRRKDLTVITAVYFGLLIGVFVTYIALLALAPFLPPSGDHPVRQWLPPVLGSVLCYICTSLLLQTRSDFRFIIPYVEFARDVKGLRPNLLDSSAIIDGRIADLVETGLFQSRFVVPTFIVDELHEAADSADKSRRIRGRRGLDILNRLRSCKLVDLEVLSSEDDGGDDLSDESRLVEMARRLHGRIITNDMNLSKAAAVRSVATINVNEVALALKPSFVAGDTFEVRLVKPGEEPGQAVGYLDDGTMVVVEGGRERIGRTVRASVTSTLQTTAGRLVFARPEA
jgi:uncharacterized protein YacL